MCKKSYEEINEKIRKQEAVVMTAEEIISFVAEQGIKEAAKKVDVVTTGTFGPMCSSGAFINFGHTDPPIKMNRVWLNGVPTYTGIAAVDGYIGATEWAEDRIDYGGAHVIEDLIAGKQVRLEATAYGTDCYPKKELKCMVDKEQLNECFLFNPRNAYQNYAAATNSTDKILHTYMGTLLPKYGNINYSTAGQLSPLLNDPYLRTIGLGSRIFLGGTEGFVAWHGTQHNPSRPRNEHGIPTGPASTLSLIGDLKNMHTDFVRAAIYKDYGVSLFVGVGIPIPILDEEMMRCVSIQDRDIQTNIFDYGIPERNRPVVQPVNYAELKSGSILLNGKRVRTAPLSSLAKARQIAEILKTWVSHGQFQIQQPIAPLPSTANIKPLNAKEID